MSDPVPFAPPQITDEDTERACSLLRMPEDAFCGADGCDPRRDVLRSMDTLDVAACPGSGKTTLLVAKLAILAEKWQHRTRGICVLSHTNAARHEIETRLGNTTAGRRLLSYPHFIGTIHAFANEFLALPWLWSRGYQISMIETDLCQTWRWNALPPGIRAGLENNHHGSSVLSVSSPDFGVGNVRWGKGHLLGITTPTYRALRGVCRRSAERGYFCYDEMLMWASHLLDRLPSVVDVIRNRFPLLFIDEAQDNSEEQSALLHRIFMDGDTAITRQRFGDGNQAVFEHVDAKEAQTDSFPNDDVETDLPNSHRFGQRLAKLADPLGLVPYELAGCGPKEVLDSGAAEGPHTIFLFGEDDCDKILAAYAALLMQTFSEAELQRGTYTAVGAVHRPSSDEHKPRHVCHYWPAYDPELASKDPKPKTFVQYVYAGLGEARLLGEIYPAVEKTAEAVLRLAGMADGDQPLRRGRYSHRHVLHSLDDDLGAKALYQELVAAFALSRDSLTKASWEGKWSPAAREIAAAVAGEMLSNQEADGFLAWSDSPDDSHPPDAPQICRDNVFRCGEGDKEVAVRVGSIHSIKGETHTATLVMETFWYQHNLEKLLPWLDGTKSGRGSSGTQQSYRLKLHYVAMTRPTHLLCLAMKRSTFEDGAGDLKQEMIAKLEQRGWQVRPI